MKNLLIGVIATVSLAAVGLSLGQGYGEVTNQPSQPMNQPKPMNQAQPGTMTGSNMNAGMTKVTLKINAPMSLIREQKKMKQPNEITLGNRTFRVPAGLESITVYHNMNMMGKPGQTVPVRIAYNNTDCKIEIVGRPMQHPNRKVTITVRERKVGNQVQGYCDKAVISGQG